MMFSWKLFKTEIMSFEGSDECWYRDNLLCIENEFYLLTYQTSVTLIFFSNAFGEKKLAESWKVLNETNQ